MQVEECAFRPEILSAFSPEVRKNMEAFAKAISHAEGVLRGYHQHTDAAFKASPKDPFEAIKINARQIFTLSWAKSILFSRSIVDNVNNRNLLSAFQAIRGYVELVATLRYTVNIMEPIIHKAADDRTISVEDARTIAGHMDILLHGGRFNWKTYFEEGVSAMIDRKKLKRTKEEKAKFETKALRIGTCINDWGLESPAAEFIYDYLCELVHPNKGSNMILLVQRDGGVVFDVNEMSEMGIDLFERVFPYAASMCMGEMGRTQPFFAALGVEEAQAAVLH
jgi:hypothetical protein